MYIYLAGILDEDEATDSSPVAESSNNAYPQSALRGAALPRDEDTGRWICEACKETFSRPENLARHRRSQHLSGNHPCPHCERHFSRSDILRRHIKSRHPDLESSGIGPTADQNKRPRSDMMIERSRRSKRSNMDYNDLQARTPSSSSGACDSAEFVRSALLDGYRDAPPGYRSASPSDRSAVSSRRLAEGVFQHGVQQQQVSLPVDGNMGSSGWNTFELPTPDQPQVFDPDQPFGGNAMDNVYLGLGANETSNLNSWIFDDSAPAFDFFDAILRDTSPLVDIPMVSSLPDLSLLTPPQTVFSDVQSDRAIVQGAEMKQYSPAHVDPFLELSDETCHRLLASLDISERLRAFVGGDRLRNWVNQFFNKFHHQLPVFHLPTLEINNMPLIVVAAMACVGGCLDVRERTTNIMIAQFIQSVQSSMSKGDQEAPRLAKIQAYLLITIASTFVGNRALYESCEGLRARLMSLCREDDIFSSLAGLRAFQLEQFEDPGVRWRRWVKLEERVRLAVAASLLDNMFPALLDLPPCHNEGDLVNAVLPCEERFWGAQTADEWTELLGINLIPSAQTFKKTVAGLYDPEIKAFTSTPFSGTFCASVMLGFIHKLILDYRSRLTVVLSASMIAPPYSRGMTPRLPSIFQGEHSHLSNMLDEWERAFNGNTSDEITDLKGLIAHGLHHLGHIRLNVSVVDLYAITGRRGLECAAQYAPFIRQWVPTPEASKAVQHSCALLQVLGNGDLASLSPFYPFMVFISTICAWSYVTYAPDEVTPEIQESFDRITSVVLPSSLGRKLETKGFQHKILHFGMSLLRKAEAWQIAASFVIALAKLL